MDLYTFNGQTEQALCSTAYMQVEDISGCQADVSTIELSCHLPHSLQSEPLLQHVMLPMVSGIDREMFEASCHLLSNMHSLLG